MATQETVRAVPPSARTTTFDFIEWAEYRNRIGSLPQLVRRMCEENIGMDTAIKAVRIYYAAEAMISSQANEGHAAKKLGMHRNSLARIMRAHGLSIAQFRAIVRVKNGGRL